MHIETWRLIRSSPSTGSWNMAVDEAIFEKVIKKKVPPTLRLYGWNPYCLSIGHAQSVSEVNTEELVRKGWDLVRRPTGGRAILHADELTYSICVRLDDPLVHGGVIESYRHLSNFLLTALEHVGIDADSKIKNEEEKHLSKDPVCFQYPSDYEITFHGKKLIGSAQARKKEGLLQHGAIPLFGDIARIISVLNFKSEIGRSTAKRNLLDRATTIQKISKKNISYDRLSNALIDAFEETFNVRLEKTSLSPGELTRAKEIQNEKYTNDSWISRI